MIVDGHCHVWRHWPYQPPVPDPESRALAEQLIHEMDVAGVERAVIIAAAIGGNPDNAADAFAAAARHPGRLEVFPDLECHWSPEVGRPGAAARLAAALRRGSFRGFTLYLGQEEDGGRLIDEEGSAFFALAEAGGLILSLSAMPHQMPAVVRLAGRFPRLPILIHHFGFVGPRSAATPGALDLVLAGARRPNIHVKFSGIGNCAGPEQEYPYGELIAGTGAIAAAYGAERMIWGSDYPVSRRHMTYRQALAFLTRHGPFAGAELAAVLGGNMARLLAAAGTSG